MVRIYSNSRIYLSEGIISTFENCSIWTRNWLLLDEQLSKVKIYLEHVPSLYSLINFFFDKIFMQDESDKIERDDAKKLL